jgi:hypothetical protein
MKNHGFFTLRDLIQALHHQGLFYARDLIDRGLTIRERKV